MINPIADTGDTMRDGSRKRSNERIVETKQGLFSGLSSIKQSLLVPAETDPTASKKEIKHYFEKGVLSKRRGSDG